MRVMTKIGLLVAAPLLSLTIVGGLGWYEIDKLNNGSKELVHEQFLPLVNDDVAHLTEDLQSSIAQITEASRETFRAVVAEKMSLVASSEEEYKAADVIHNQGISRARELLAEAEHAFETEETQQLYATLMEQIDIWEEKSEKVVAGAMNPARVTFSRRMSNGGSAEQTFQAMQETLSALEQAQKSQTQQLLAKVGSKKEAVEKQAIEAEQQAKQLVVLFAGVVVVSFVVTILLAGWIGRALVRSINALVISLKDIAEGEGDLTQRVDEDRKDELGELGKWFNTFVHKIHDVICEVRDTAHDVAGAATQIAASSDEMAHGISEQNQQVTQISAAVEEMSASIIEVARKSGEAANNARESGRVAEEGGQVVSDTIDGMNQISEAVSASAASVSELGKRGEQIGQIISVINDIADQTNLLALNAAIEAARAGEHGRGFAVVADEVRKLADRTTKATEEIGESITAIQTETEQAVQRMTAGTEQVQIGVEKATQAGQSLEQIVSGAQEVATMIQSIAAAAEEQTVAGEEVSRGIQQVSAVTNQSAEGASQSSQAANQLSAKAEQLQLLVGRFKL